MKITKIAIYLFLIFLLAFSLRAVIATNFDLNPDEMAYSLHPFNIISAGRLSTIHQSTLHAYSTDIIYQLFGFGTFSSRFLPVLFGSLSTILLFLIGREMFNSDKVGLMAAFLAAVSGFNVLNNLEPDIPAFFFLLFSILFYMKFVKTNSNKWMYLSIVFLGLASLFKVIVASTILTYFIFYLIYKRKYIKRKVFLKKSLRVAAISFLLLVLVFSPVFAYNYFSYNDSGVTDYYFSTLLGIGKNVEQRLGGQNPWSFTKLTRITKIKLVDQFLINDPLVLIFGLIGLVYIFKRKNKWAAFFPIILISLWVYLAGRTGSDTHYVIFLLLLSLPAAKMILFFAKKFNFKKVFPVVIVLALAISFVSLNEILLNSPSGSLELRSYASSIPDNAIIVVDPLIYTGNAIWAFGDKHYIIGTQFPTLVEQLNQAPGPRTRVPLYYVKCSGENRYCGWKPEDQARVFNFSESLSGHFKKSLTFLTDVKGSDYFRFSVYQGEIDIVPQIYQAIDQTHWFYFYPIGWKYTDNVLDNYSLDGFSDKILNWLAFSVLYLEVLIVILSPFLLMFFVSRRKKFKKDNEVETL